MAAQIVGRKKLTSRFYGSGLTTGQKFSNFPPDNKIELLEFGY